jgi:transmembrane sensor
LRLSPNQQLKFDHDTNNLLIKDIDVFNEISWKEGIFSFENVTLEEVMKVLSRWYNAEIIIKNESIKNKEFIGILRKNRKIETVLESIKSYDIIQNYLIEDDRIELE